MRIARLELTGPDPASQAAAEVVVDVLWAHLEPGHGIEHITATATARGIDLAVFVRHRIEDPNRYADEVFGVIVGKVPALRNWKCRQLD